MIVSLIKTLLLIMLLVNLGSFVLAWHFWFKIPSQAPLPIWRKRLLLSALLAASCAMLIRLVGAYWWNYKPGIFGSQAMEWTHMLAIIMFPLLLWALIAAFFGRGAVKVCLMLYCVLMCSEHDFFCPIPLQVKIAVVMSRFHQLQAHRGCECWDGGGLLQESSKIICQGRRLVSSL
jgi:hypothetical protein